MDRLNSILTSYYNRKSDNIVLIGLKFKERPANIHDIDKYFAEHVEFDIVALNFAHNSEEHWIFLRLLPSPVREILGKFAQHYFPSSKTCSSRPLSVDIDKWGTWGNRYAITVSHQSYFPETVFGVFIPDHCGHHNGNRFATRERCPHLINKFNCMFFPSTNCSFPDALKDCESSRSLSGDFYYFSNATEQGRLLEGAELEAFRSTERIRSLPTVGQSVRELGRIDLAPFRWFDMKSVETIAADSVAVQTRSEFPYSDHIATSFMFGLHYRQSLGFRSLVQQVVERTRFSAHFGQLRPTDSCVALHVRKDDRTLPGLEGRMRDWCRDHTNSAAKSREQAPTGSHHGFHLSYGVWMDFGCLYSLPYGDAGLEHFLNASLAMFPDERNIFVMTDDPDWLDKSARRVLGVSSLASPVREGKEVAGTERRSAAPQYANLRLFPLASRRLLELPGTDLYEANAEFWASIELARQCRGLVLHPGSAAARFIAQALCFRSRGTDYLRCPDIFDIAGREIL
jgi:hypothetical protein